MSLDKTFIIIYSKSRKALINMKQITKKALINWSFVLFFAIISLGCTSFSQAQGYIGKKNIITYRGGFSPFAIGNRTLISGLSHELSLERVKNRYVSYGLEAVYGMGKQTGGGEGVYDFNFIIPSIFIRLHGLGRGSIAPLGVSNKLGVGIAMLNYNNNTTTLQSGVSLALSWSVMKRVPLSKTLLFDYGTGFSVPIGTASFQAMGATLFSLRLGLGFAVK